ncbi:MAG: hypothetical protein ACK4J0_03715 [Candidatus Anstonellaceae archaeon]
MILFDKLTIFLYGLVLGLCGIPWAFYLLRKEEEYGIVEKIFFGYSVGIILLPLLFVFELIIGIKFQLFLVYINWLAVFLIGLVLNLKEIIKSKLKVEDIKKIFTGFDFLKPNLEVLFSKLILVFLIFAIFWIGYSVSGIPIMDLDPYFYLDGVRQVVYEGYNYFNDKTAWYPLPISSHVGNPIWKYTIASWFSLYYNPNLIYDPYILIAVGSVFPPIIGGLSVFFAYLLFKELYDRKTALLVAGAVAFAPAMLIKFQGGDFQIEPYNILAFLFALYGFVYFFKRNFSPKSLAVLTFSLICLFLGSNIGPFFSLFFAIVIFVLAILSYISPQQEWIKIEKFLFFVGALSAILIIYLLYYIVSKADSIAIIITIAKMLAPPILAVSAYYLFNSTSFFKKEKDTYKKLWILFFLGLAGLVILFIFLQIPQIKGYLIGYIGAGGYTVPLVRTIAEQNPGPSSYAGSLGFFGEDYSNAEKRQNIGGGGFGITRNLNFLQDSSLLAQLHNYRIAWLNTFSYPSLVIDGVYSIFNEIGNVIVGPNTYEYIPKNISFFSLVTFLAIAFSFIYTIYKIRTQKKWELDVALTIALLPVLIISFGKQKFVMYCTLIGIIYTGIAFGLGQRIFEALINKYKKESLKYWTIGIFNFIGLIAIITNPSLLAAGAFTLSFVSILILLFYDYFLEKRNIVFLALVLILIAAEFFSSYLFSFEILNLNSSKPNKVFELMLERYGINAYALFINSFTPRIYDDINKVAPLMIEQCKTSANPNDPICFALEQINSKNYSDLNPIYYYNREMCVRSIFVQDKRESIDKQLAYSYRCSMVNYYWLDVMYWISKNTEKDARIISWWDYGHWINFFGQRNAVLRNEQASLEMIGQTATAFLHKDLNFLKQTMREFGSKYALFDVEIVGSGSSKQDIQLGGKYHALNYLGCAWQNRTNVSFYPGQSECEKEHIWEQVIIPTNQKGCVISAQKNLTGLVGYRIDYFQQTKTARPEYCFTEEYTPEGSAIRAYLLNQKNADGELELKKAEWRAYKTNEGILLIAFYTKFPQWIEKDGKIVDGWSDRTTKYYDSNLYSAYFFDNLDGFELVYNSPQIRIFKLKE